MFRLFEGDAAKTLSEYYKQIASNSFDVLFTIFQVNVGGSLTSEEIDIVKELHLLIVHLLPNAPEGKVTPQRIIHSTQSIHPDLITFFNGASLLEIINFDFGSLKALDLDVLSSLLVKLPLIRFNKLELNQMHFEFLNEAVGIVVENFEKNMSDKSVENLVLFIYQFIVLQRRNGLIQISSKNITQILPILSKKIFMRQLRKEH